MRSLSTGNLLYKDAVCHTWGARFSPFFIQKEINYDERVNLMNRANHGPWVTIRPLQEPLSSWYNMNEQIFQDYTIHYATLV